MWTPASFNALVHILQRDGTLIPVPRSLIFSHEANIWEFFLCLECETACQLTIEKRKRFLFSTSEDRCSQVFVITVSDEYKCYHSWALSFVYFFRLSLRYLASWETHPQTLVNVLCHYLMWQHVTAFSLSSGTAPSNHAAPFLETSAFSLSSLMRPSLKTRKRTNGAAMNLGVSANQGWGLSRMRFHGARHLSLSKSFQWVILYNQH